MIYLSKSLFCLYILLDVLNGYGHILDKSTVREGDQFTINCSLKRALSGKTGSYELRTLFIIRMSSNGSQETIAAYFTYKKAEKNNFNRPWIFKGFEQRYQKGSDSDLCISVEVVDAKCSDATQYMCRGLYKTNVSLSSDAIEELKRDASCDKKEVSTAAGVHIKTPKRNSARQEATPMRWQLVGAIITVGMLAK
ncbi:unnamed protein product [Lymnaea stagnalis]|uniref:Uncharacterized protein n=1 Tax=Lymnaea stagnalis TaxID=6523 RepID=A0AAV2H3R3_LYMST